MKSKIQKIIFIVFILTDTAYSFYQFNNTRMDGDIGMVSFAYPEVMRNPFGFSVITEHKSYGAPNRFFVHFVVRKYFLNAPLFFQRFVSPVESAYLACALIKTIIQLFILWTLALLISRTKNMLHYRFLLAAVLIVPLFQTSGYNTYMGIISKSVTYSFFYGLSIGLLMLYCVPFYLSSKEKKFSFAFHVMWMIFAMVLAFSGPLNPGCALIIALLVLIYFTKLNAGTSQKSFFQSFIQTVKKPNNCLFHFLFFGLISLYSLYIGRNNSENSWWPVPVLNRYMNLPAGLYYIFTQKPGMWLLLLMILINLFLISKQSQTGETRNMFSLIKWLSIFCLLYTLLLPLGGYRLYRPNIIRVDTFIPVILCMFFIYGITTLYLLESYRSKFSSVYKIAVILLLLAFTWADQPMHETACERNAMEKIAQSTEKIVALDNDCLVMSWRKIYDYHESQWQAEMLMRWRITKEKKLFFMKQ
jgi:hypothetical protein